MRNKLYTTLFVASLLFTFACKKNNSPSPGDDTPVVKKKYLVKAAVGANATDYTYDSKKRLSKIVAGSATTTYSYDDQHLLSVELFSGGTKTSRTISQFKYDGDEINTIGQKIYTNDTLKRENTIIYLYDNGRAKEIRSGTDVTTYTYDSKNNIVTNVYKGPVTISNTTLYDDRKSKFTNSLTKYLIYPTVDVGNDRFSPNNITQNTQEFNGKSTVTNYTYTYDDEGYPLTVNDGRTTTTYTYSTLD